MQSVTLTRKERIMKERTITAKNRKRKVLGYALAGSVATSVLLSSAHLEKASACSDMYTVQKGDTLSELAKKYGVSVKQMKEANELTSDFIKVGQVLEVPLLEDTHAEHMLSATKKSVQPEQVKQSMTKKETNKVYTVVPGDSLYILAKKYGVQIEQIQTVNGLTSDMIKVGQKLEIPSGKVYKAKKQMINNLGEKMTYATYTVSPGETLGDIARQFNISIDEIKAYNHMSSNAVLIGQELMIKQKNLMKVNATVGGAVDNFSVEFIINGEPTVLKVAYGTTDNFERISGEKIELVFYKAHHSALVSYSLAK